MAERLTVDRRERLPVKVPVKSTQKGALDCPKNESSALKSSAIRVPDRIFAYFRALDCRLEPARIL